MPKVNSIDIVQLQRQIWELFNAEADPPLVFHTFNQAEETAAEANELAQEENLSEKDTQLVLAAAWLQFTGYTRDYRNAVQASVQISRELLSKQNGEQTFEEEVCRLIRENEEGSAPGDAMSAVLHDATWSYLGRKRFFRKTALLRLELEEQLEQTYSHADWEEKMQQLLIRKKFFTAAGRNKYLKRKNKNILEQSDNLKKARKKTRRKKTGKDFGRGIDTLYRNTLRGHIDLSSIADGKANMIISINTLVLSILITGGSASISLSTFDARENLIIVIPVLILMTTSLGAIIFAVLSAIPKYASFGKNNIKKDETERSRLFFNNFLELPQKEFIAYLRELKRDQEDLYDELAKDVYNLGSVLKKKYALLDIAYKLFVGGLACSFLAFLIILLLE